LTVIANNAICFESLKTSYKIEGMNA